MRLTVNSEYNTLFLDVLIPFKSQEFNFYLSVDPRSSVSEKVFDMPDIMSEAYRSSIGHCSVSIGHWEHIMLILHDYCRTICPMFYPKTSDVGVRTLY